MTFPPPISAATPQDFFRPGVDEGLWLLRPESMEPVPFERANITWISLASDHAMRLNNDGLMRGQSYDGDALLFPGVIAYAQNVTINNVHMAIDGKYLLNSAGRRRILSIYVNGDYEGESEETKLARDNALVAYLDQGAQLARPLPLWDGPDPRDLDFVIDTRNFHNFHHFTKEALPLLTLYASYGLRGRIVFYGNNENISPFVYDSISTWFPELSDRITLTGSKSDDDGYSADAALIAYDTLGYAFHTNSPTIRNLTRPRFKLDRKVRDLARLTVEAPLVAMRAHVLQQIDRTQAPKRRLYVQRRATRLRAVVNESLLTDILNRHGFHTIAFEDLSVSEQAATVANCEALVTIHGAGVTNMLYAPSSAKVFELSNTQTLTQRFGDFNPVANAAAVTYAHIFLDHDHPDPSYVPNIARDKHRGVRFTPFSAAATAAYILSKLDEEAASKARSACEAANSRGDFAQLDQLLDQHQDIIAHLADYHVWRANIAAQQHNRPEVLRNLTHALILAPRRIMLIKRLLPVAAELRDQTTFDFAARQLQRIDEAQFIALFAKHKWPLPQNVTLRGTEDDDLL